MSVRITVEDLVTGETATRELENDVVVLVTGNHYIDGITRYANGTKVYTIKVDKS